MRYKIKFWIASLIFILITVLIIKEKIREKQNIEKIYSNYNSIKTEIEIDNKIKEREKELIQNVYWDTIDLKKSGIIITKNKLVSDEYSNYKDIQLSYKNISGKNIKAIKFRWYIENAFNKPADCGGIEAGFGGGFDDNLLKINHSVTNTWDVSSIDGYKIIKVWPTKVVYSDETSWSSKSK